MAALQFTAYSVSNEIDLNRIAQKCGISKKYTWEEPLTLKGSILQDVMGHVLPENPGVMLFSFGSVVFINFPKNLYPAFIQYLRQFIPDDISDWTEYTDEYALIVRDDEEALTDEYAVVAAPEPFYTELVADVLAKSVALERVETHMGKILDSLESLIEHLEKGNLHIGDKKLAKVVARVARHEFDSISYIMILDKPDITWANSQAGDFYQRLSEFFELNDRYEIIKSKTEVSNNIITGFSSISHAFRGLRVELVIVVLILIEIVLMVLEILK